MSWDRRITPGGKARPSGHRPIGKKGVPPKGKRNVLSDRCQVTVDHWREAKVRTMFVYAIVVREPLGDPIDNSIVGPVKIGFSVTPAERISNLQGGNPRRLDMAAVIYGSTITERVLHAHFKDLRMPRSEWFEASALGEIIAVFREVDWVQRHGAEVDRINLSEVVVRDVLASRGRKAAA